MHGFERADWHGNWQAPPLRIDAKPQNMISEGLKILAFLQLKLRWPANPGQGPEGAVAQRRVACRALSGAGLAAQYLST